MPEPAVSAILCYRSFVPLRPSVLAPSRAGSSAHVGHHGALDQQGTFGRGKALRKHNGLAGAAIALGAVFLPGLLVLLGALPFWDAFRRKPLAQAALRGTNAAVVGILAAALYDPVWTSAVLGPMDVVLALVGFLALTAARA